MFFDISYPNQQLLWAQIIEEAQGAFSPKDFAAKISICLKEAKESNYFYRIIQALNLGNQTECARLTRESDELQKIFASILIKVKMKK